MLQDFDYKSLTMEELEWAYQDVAFKRKPRWHQYVSLAFAEDKSRVCFWHGVGTGKTLAAYYAAQRKGCKHILVVCPKHAVSSWIRDIKWTDYSYTLISGETPERKRRMSNSDNVHIIPYHALKTVFSSLKNQSGTIPVATGLSREEVEEYLKQDTKFQPVASRTTPGTWNVVKPKSRRWAIDQSEIERYNFDGLILDEVHRCNSSATSQSKICRAISARTPNVIALTGTPVDRVLLEMFHIYEVVDLGATFGTNFWRFRLDHFEKCGLEYRVRPGHENMILQQAMPITLSFSTEECLDLPECIEDVILLDPTPQFRDLEQRIILQEPIDVAGSNAIFSEASVRSSKLKQLSGGFLYLPEDIVYHLKENPKLEAILDLLDNTGEKIIVWYRFVEVRKIISKALQSLSIPFVNIGGGMSSEEVVEVQRQFQDDSSIRVITCQETCNEGWDGFAAGIMVFWDLIISPRQREQCIGRMHRQGQKKRTVVYDLVLRDTVDESVLQRHITQQNEIDIYMQYMQSYTLRSRTSCEM